MKLNIHKNGEKTKNEDNDWEEEVEAHWRMLSKKKDRKRERTNVTNKNRVQIKKKERKKERKDECDK